MSLPSQPPPSLKPVSHYLKVALEHDTRDKVIAYWARFAAVQKSLTIDKSSPEAKVFVIKLLEWLEVQKKELAGNEAITIEAAGEAHVEDYAIKLFSWADQSDRSGVFNKNVVKAFYTAGILFDILESLSPPLSEEFSTSRKYSKWKAAYIHNCLKNGETPIPGSNDDNEQEDQEHDEQARGATGGGGNNFYGFMNPTQQYPPPNQNLGLDGPPADPINYGAQPQQPYVQPAPASTPTTYDFQATAGGATGPNSLSVEQIAKAQKYCKWAGSALNFDDVNGAIENLEKALLLLKTGQES